MFATDLPLEKEAETVGARRERKARERSTRASSIDTVSTARSSRASISTERELWWSAGFKKAKSIKPKILRPSTGQSGSSQKTAKSVSTVAERLELKKAGEYKDPALQPSWTYTSTISATLPSGDTLHVQDHTEVQELEGGEISSRTDSADPEFSRGRKEVVTPVTVDSIDDVTQRASPASFVTSRSRASSSTPEPSDSASSSTADARGKGKTSPRPEEIVTPEIETLELHDSPQEKSAPTDNTRRVIQTSNGPLNVTNKRFSQWECLQPRGLPTGMQLKMPSQTTPTKVVMTNNSSMQRTRFQRFIRRMEGAGPKVILDRLKEDWQVSTSDGADEELVLEKQLWLLTGFQMQNIGRDKSTPKPECNTGRVLELYGNLSEVYQLSAMHPSQTVHFLTTKPQKHVPLPNNVSYLTVRKFGVVPLPYPEDYFSHIRASTLPSLVPSAKLPELFSECHKLLAPGGYLEIRIMDAAPVRKTAGPLMRTWIEDRLSVNLERLFRCSKPCSLVPVWLTDAGFEMAVQEDDQGMTLPCALDPDSATVDDELSTIIGRALWKDIWGSFVDDSPDEPKWWWEDEEIVQECIKRQTSLECKTIFAYKR
ncbi:hypothetical protein TW65_04548 [Stemphylium lycopersici]|nr:hypothetical protein TW65_04548 [Stemphylium lycopersici]